VTILDFEMPDMDGLAVLRQIREIDPRAPVIMLTGAGTEDREKQARELGVTDFLAKGFSLHEVGAALNLVLKQSVQGAGGSRLPHERPGNKRGGNMILTDGVHF
jgi:DNA-binding response OmpR family regulator